MNPNLRFRRHEIQILRSCGEGIRSIARKLNISRNTVKKWARKEKGDILDAKRPGRATKFSAKAKEKVRKWVKDKPGMGTRKVAKRLNMSEEFREEGKTVSHMAVSKYLRKTKWGKTCK